MTRRSGVRVWQTQAVFTPHRDCLQQELWTGRRQAAGCVATPTEPAGASEQSTSKPHAPTHSSTEWPQHAVSKQVGTLALHQSPWPGRAEVMWNRILQFVAQQGIPCGTEGHSELTLTAFMWSSVTKP